MQINKNSVLSLLGYACGNIGASLSQGMMPLLLLYFLTQYGQLSPIVAGGVLAAPKIWDMLVDPAIGRASDKLSVGRFGRPTVILYCGFTLAVLTPLAFLTPPLGNTWLTAAYYVAVQIVLATLFTAFGVSYLAQADEMSATPTERSKYLTANGLGGTVGTLAIMLAAPALIAFGGGGVKGYWTLSVAVAGTSSLLVIIGWLAIRRKRRTNANHAMETQSPSIFEVFRSACVDRAFIACNGAVLCCGAALGCFSAFMPYESKYLLGKTAEDLSALATPFIVASGVGLFLVPSAIRWLGNVGAVRAAYVTAAAGFALFWLGITTNFFLLTVVGSTAFGVGLTVVSVSLTAIALDLAKNRPDAALVGVYLGFFLSASKLGSSLGSVIAGVLLYVVGFSADMGVDADAFRKVASISFIGPFLPLFLGSILTFAIRGPLGSSVRA